VEDKDDPSNMLAQKRHLMASSLIVSAQNGHFFVSVAALASLSLIGVSPYDLHLARPI
jgi:hypothetical protein